VAPEKQRHHLIIFNYMLNNSDIIFDYIVYNPDIHSIHSHSEGVCSFECLS